ncbi:MAG TPA: hypothetical protein VGV69_04140, partial [Solirubrobacterales bacterium]|nr:hypothetical protein [Solirubrobacterales bacterium]
MTIALALLLVAAPAAAAKTPPRTHLLFLPPQTTVADLAAAGLSPGTMSPGLGAVPLQQTYLDITQGNRLFDSLYNQDLPELHDNCASWRRVVIQRAESAPADIVPGLLSSTLAAAGAEVRGRGETSCVFSPPPNSDGPRRSAKKLSAAPSPDPRPPTFEARKGTLNRLPSLRRNDLLIAIAKPTGTSGDLVAIGIAGHGFDGNLTSDSTRMDGYVLSTDVAPTILDRLGIEVPSEMSGRPIRAEGSVDPAAVESLVERLDVIPSRRGPVIGLTAVAWLALMALFAFVGRGGPIARSAVRLFTLSAVYLPLLLLLGAALKPGETTEALLVALGSPVLAALTLSLLGGYRPLA